MATTRRRLCAVLLPALLCVPALLSGCGRGKSGRLTLAVVPKGTTHEFWKAVHAGALQGAQALGIDIVWKGPDPEGDRQAQIHLVQNFVSRGVDGIVLAPVDDRALATTVAEAKAAGVPVAVIDSGLLGDAHIAFVATDNREGGALGARRLVEVLGGKGKVVVLRFMQGSASTTEREAGALAVFAQSPGIEIVSSDQYAESLEKAQQTAESLLVAHPDVDGVFCPNESTTHGFLLALRRKGSAGRVKFVGFDASEPLVDGLAQGHIHGLVLQDPVTMGRRGVEVLVAHLRAQPFPREEKTDLNLATPENRDEPRIKSLLRPDTSIVDR